ncbi:MAG: hypothetical protein L7S45_02340 [Luminiphilus sp.]|nr:hypothetical protein [Luminiphilus sp.]
MDDRFFDILPDWYREKLTGRGPILSDLARLLHIRKLLEHGVDAVIWLDADTLIIDRDWSPSMPAHSLLGAECWLQRDKRGKLEVKRQPHNAFMMFTQASPILDFLIHTTQSIIQRIDANHIAPQVVGPKLLKALHPLAEFDLEHKAAAMSTDLLAGLMEEDRDLLMFYRGAQPSTPASFNVCASLHGSVADIDLDLIRARVCQYLVDHK